MIGLANHERVDEELYDDFETAKAREVHFILFQCFEIPWINCMMRSAQEMLAGYH